MTKYETVYTVERPDDIRSCWKAVEIAMEEPAAKLTLLFPNGCDDTVLRRLPKMAKKLGKGRELVVNFMPKKLTISSRDSMRTISNRLNS